HQERGVLSAGQLSNLSAVLWHCLARSSCPTRRPGRASLPPALTSASDRKIWNRRPKRPEPRLSAPVVINSNLIDSIGTFQIEKVHVHICAVPLTRQDRIGRRTRFCFAVPLA